MTASPALQLSATVWCYWSPVVFYSWQIYKSKYYTDY